MQKIATLLLAVACICLVGCSDVYEVSYDYDEQYPISSIRSYGWMPPTKRNRARGDQLTYQRIQAAIASDLEKKGMVGAEDTPDIRIQVVFGGKNRSARTGRRGRYRYKEGHLHIEFIDPTSDALVWVGSARTILADESTPDVAQKTIDDVVGKILANFPPS